MLNHQERAKHGDLTKSNKTQPQEKKSEQKSQKILVKRAKKFSQTDDYLPNKKLTSLTETDLRPDENLVPVGQIFADQTETHKILYPPKKSFFFNNDTDQLESLEAGSVKNLSNDQKVQIQIDQMNETNCENDMNFTLYDKSTVQVDMKNDHVIS